MELDDYISKYIDSELTDEEDVRLREMLSEDDFARDKFDSAVTVHLAMKEDSQAIEPPEDIYRQTEDIVLMKILASQPIIAERPVFWRRTQLLAAMIVFLIFSFIFKIDDLQFNRLKPDNSFSDSGQISPASENTIQGRNQTIFTGSDDRIRSSREFDVNLNSNDDNLAVSSLTDYSGGSGTLNNNVTNGSVPGNEGDGKPVDDCQLCARGGYL